MKVENLNGRPNQFLITDNNRVAFQSYKSLIAEYDRETNTLKLYSEWNYSQTTLRHFKAFINEETSFNYINKAQWEKEIKNNPNIKEV